MTVGKSNGKWGRNCEKTTQGHEKTNSYKFVKTRSVADHRAREKKKIARSYRKATSVGTDAFLPRALFRPQ